MLGGEGFGRGSYWWWLGGLVGGDVGEGVREGWPRGWWGGGAGVRVGSKGLRPWLVRSAPGARARGVAWLEYGMTMGWEGGGRGGEGPWSPGWRVVSNV